MSIFIDVKVKGIVESIASVHFVEGILQFGCFKPLYVICKVSIIDRSQITAILHQENTFVTVLLNSVYSVSAQLSRMKTYPQPEFFTDISRF